MYLCIAKYLQALSSLYPTFLHPFLLYINFVSRSTNTPFLSLDFPLWSHLPQYFPIFSFFPFTLFITRATCGSPSLGFALGFESRFHTFDPTGFAKLRHVTISMHVHVTHFDSLLCFRSSGLGSKRSVFAN